MNRIVSVTWGTWHLLIVHLADIDINASGQATAVNASSIDRAPNDTIPEI
jgi:hypothetical protein